MQEAEITMAQYELSIEPDAVAEAERLVSLEGRGFPTLVVHWEAQMLGQEWSITLVLDYTIPLPPLESGKTFNEVRIAAFTDQVPTKFLYFGTELTADAPRVAPEMENMVSPSGRFQEYRLDATTCAVPYLSLIQTTPRIYGNGPQDYYSPPIKIERFDAGPGNALIADNFAKIVADLPPTEGAALTDPSGGFWRGSRFVGTKQIAILRQGVVVGLCDRTGRAERDVVPPAVERRDPHVDVRDGWVAIDFGAATTVVAIGDSDKSEFIRLGASRPPVVARDFENPSEIGFHNLSRVLKAWRDRVILPLTRWGDLYVGHAAAARRTVHGKERALRTRSSVAELASLPGRLEAGNNVVICGRSDLDDTFKLSKPAPPIIDEEGIGADDPFDPIELYAYYIGLHVNTRHRGIHLRYAIGMPTGWNEMRRNEVTTAFRRGILRSLPAGMVAFDDLDLLQVVDSGLNVLAFAAQAFRVFGALPKPGEAVPFVSIDAGASEMAVLCGLHRHGSLEETVGGFDRVVEHVAPTVLPHFGGESLLHRMALQVFVASATAMKHNEIPFMLPPSTVADGTVADGQSAAPEVVELLSDQPEAQVNVRLLKDAVRPVLESSLPQPLPDLLPLFAKDGRVRDVRIIIDRTSLVEWLRAQLSQAAVEIKDAVVAGFERVTRNTVGFDELRVFMGGRVSMHPVLAERLASVLPQGVRIHCFREPDETNIAAPTVKLATALGILTLRNQQMSPTSVSDDRSSFKFRVGRGKRGKMLVVLDASTVYDQWCELGACTRPEVSVLYLPTEASASIDIDIDASGVRSVLCNLGYDAVGYRVYLRAVSGSRVEVSVGPPGGRPDDDAPRFALDLVAGTCQRIVGD
jgi:hypothetical protein